MSPPAHYNPLPMFGLRVNIFSVSHLSRSQKARLINGVWAALCKAQRAEIHTLAPSAYALWNFANTDQPPSDVP